MISSDKFIGRPIVFLDTNGVLNFTAHRIRELKMGRSISFVDLSLSDKALKFVSDLVMETGALVVCTSSWRLHKEDGHFKNLENQLRNKAGIEIYDTTPYIGLNGSKSIEIEQWLYQNRHLNISRFVVIDDKVIQGLEDKLVKCDSEYGFTTTELYNKAINILQATA